MSCFSSVESGLDELCRKADLQERDWERCLLYVDSSLGIGTELIYSMGFKNLRSLVNFFCIFCNEQLVLCEKEEKKGDKYDFLSILSLYFA